MIIKQEKSIIEDYLPCKWEAGAKGPYKYDCYSLVMEIQERFYGTELPKVNVDVKNLFAVIKSITRDPVWKKFKKIEKPVDGCIVKLFTCEYPDHIGVYVKRGQGGILHCSKKWNVSFDSLFTLRQIFAKIEFYKYIG